VGKIQALLVLRRVGFVLGQANVPECTVGILFLSFILFTVVVFFTLSDNGLRLGEGGDFHHKC